MSARTFLWVLWLVVATSVAAVLTLGLQYVAVHGPAWLRAGWVVTGNGSYLNVPVFGLWLLGTGLLLVITVGLSDAMKAADAEDKRRREL